MANVKGIKVSACKFSNEAEAKAILKSQEVLDELTARAERIAASLNSEGCGEFRSGVGTHGKTRHHVFVNTYDYKSRATANEDPSIFYRHMRS